MGVPERGGFHRRVQDVRRVLSLFSPIVGLPRCCSRVANLVSGEVYFGTIPSEHWYQPDWIDEDRAKRGRDQLVENNVIYGGAFLTRVIYLC